MHEIDINPLTIRFPTHLLEQLYGMAKQNNLSLNGEILSAFQEHIKKQQQGK